MIHIDHLSFEYPRKRALTDVSFRIGERTVTALVGPNGAGKTTLLCCMAGLKTPYAGEIMVGGVDVLREPRKAHGRIGWLPDFFGLYDALTVEQALTYFALAQKVDKSLIPERISRILARVDLVEKRVEKVGGLSRGMRQRLALGQALMHDPAVLLLDEPASGLDPESRASLAGLFLELKDEGKTLVVSSHILSELNEYADDLIILKEGRVVDHAISLARRPAGLRLCIETDGPWEGMRAFLEEADGVSAITVSDAAARMRFTGDAAARASLLRALLDAGAPVVQFYEEKERLQEQYLEAVRKKPEEEPGHVPE